jgi:hypothetical protein
MKKIIILLILTFTDVQFVYADQDSDIYNGILAEAKIPDSSILNLGRQGRAILFASTLETLGTMKHADVSPMTFQLNPDSSSNVTSFVGEATVMSINGPVCTYVNVTATGHFPSNDKSYRNIYVEAVNLKVTSSEQCL